MTQEKTVNRIVERGIKMKKIRIICGVLATVLLISALPARPSAASVSEDNFVRGIEVGYDSAAPEEDVEAFVERLYTFALNRASDQDGKAYWAKKLRMREYTGTAAAYGFIFSDEFQSRAFSHRNYVTTLYMTFFGRYPDADGLEHWVNKLQNGTSREEVFAGFVNSPEFFELCRAYGIVAGTHIVGEDPYRISKVNLFVSDLYNVVLERECDREGMLDWTQRLIRGSITGIEAGYGFFFSEEYRKKNKTDEEFVLDLYRATLARTPDEMGYRWWCSYLANDNVTDLDLFNSFVTSVEFIEKCKKSGIKPGEPIITSFNSARVQREKADKDNVNVNPGNDTGPKSFEDGKTALYFAKETSTTIYSKGLYDAVDTVTWTGFNVQDTETACFTDTNSVTFSITCSGRFSQNLYYAFYYTNDGTTDSAWRVTKGTLYPLSSTKITTTTTYRAMHGIVNENLKPGKYLLIVSSDPVNDDTYKDYLDKNKGSILISSCDVI